MATQAHDEVRQSVADHLEVEAEDLILIDDHEPSYTYRQSSTGQMHTAHVVIGPEGPVVTIDE